MKKKTKKLKGMTLVECIVALAILSVFTTGMATAASGLTVIRKNTNDVVRKNSYQSTWADNKIGSFCNDTENCKIVITDAAHGYSRTFTTTKHTAKTAQTDAEGKIIYDPATGNPQWDTSNGRDYQYFTDIVVKP